VEISTPSGTISVAAGGVSVVSGASVAVPTVDLVVAANTPSVASGAAVTVSSAIITIVALVPAFANSALGQRRVVFVSQDSRNRVQITSPNRAV
jgi:hypothetical protein